jgi:predicted nicotinamide N-methyase
VADLIEQVVDLGGTVLSILRPADAEALLDEEAFAHEEFLPYWAELWPSGVALAQEVSERAVEGLRVAELGSGLGLPSLAAAIGGARVVATDWSPDAIALLRRNAHRNGAELELLVCSWDDASPLVERGPFDLVLAADVLYERRNVDQLLALLPCLVADGEVLLADPGRPHLTTFLDAARDRWRIETTPRPESRNLALYSLRK